MANISIALEKRSRYRHVAEQLVKDAEIIGIDAKIKNIYGFKYDSKKEIIYFLSSSPQVKVLTHELLRYGSRVVNAQFILRDLSKLAVQRVLKKSGISIPFFIAYDAKLSINDVSKKIGFPLFLKSPEHGKVIKITNQKSLKKDILKVTQGWYLEENVNKEDLTMKKFYYVNGFMSMEYEQTIPAKISQILNTIANSLDIKVFSCDIFINDKGTKYYCIDVNHAPGFMCSNEARGALIKYASED